MGINLKPGELCGPYGGSSPSLVRISVFRVRVSPSPCSESASAPARRYALSRMVLSAGKPEATKRSFRGGASAQGDSEQVPRSVAGRTRRLTRAPTL